MTLYFDTNVFYNAYVPTEKANEIADWLFEQMTEQFPIKTSEWSIIEFFRALKKQENLNNLSSEDVNLISDFFIGDIVRMQQEKILHLIPVTIKLIIRSKRYIFSHNLYASDALHITTAIMNTVSAFVSFDADFNTMSNEIQILNPYASNFKARISKMKRSVDY